MLHGSRAKSASLPLPSEQYLQPNSLKLEQKVWTVCQQQKTSYTGGQKQMILVYYFFFFLSPFNFFTSDLEDVMQCTLIKFAADTKLGWGREIPCGSQGCHSQRPRQAGATNWPMATSWSSPETKAKSITTGDGTGWAGLGWGAALRGRRGTLVHRELCVSQQDHSPSIKGQDYPSPCSQHSEDHIQILRPGLALPLQERWQ